MSGTHPHLTEAQEHVEECQQCVLDQESSIKGLIQAGRPHADALTLLRLLQDALQLAEINRDIQEIIEYILDEDTDYFAASRKEVGSQSRADD